MSKSKNYEEFVEKFKPKKTTDDCYTPKLAYDVVACYVSEKYGVNQSKFLRPFFPGGNYQEAEYPADCVVVDNPPFSILSRILKFYDEKGIKYFLFAPSMTVFSSIRSAKCCAIFCDLKLIYANGASVNTAFVTNMEPKAVTIADPVLAQLFKRAQEKEKANNKKELPKYKYPDNVLTASMLNKYAKYGIDFVLSKGSGCFVSALDAQKASGKTIFGTGLIISEKAAAEKAAAEKAAAEKAAAEKAAAEKAAAEKAAAIKWELSEREWDIILNLGG